MAKVINPNKNRQFRDEVIWNDFAEKSHIAQKTLKYKDAVEARRVWQKWLEVDLNV